MPVRAVIFDLGGVVLHSPLVAIDAYERALGLPHDYLNVQITSRGQNGAWQRFERGEIHDIRDFYADFGRELSDTVHGNEAYVKHVKRQSPGASESSETLPLPKQVSVDGRELFGKMMYEGSRYQEVVLEAIHRIRQSKRFIVASITNNFDAPYKLLLNHPPSPSSSPAFDPKAELEFLSWSEGPVPPSLRGLFDIFIDSSEVGMRKPERGIYELMLEKLKERDGMEVGDVVMLDDLGMNLKVARELGMRTIHVPIGGDRKAIEQLQAMLEIPLLDPETTSAKSGSGRSQSTSTAAKL